MNLICLECFGNKIPEIQKYLQGRLKKNKYYYLASVAT